MDYFGKLISLPNTNTGLDLPDAKAIKSNQTNNITYDWCSKCLVNYHKSEFCDCICIHQRLSQHSSECLQLFTHYHYQLLYKCAELVTIADVTLKLKGLCSGTCTSCSVDNEGRLLTDLCIIAEAHVRLIVLCDQCCSTDG